MSVVATNALFKVYHACLATLPWKEVCKFMDKQF